MYNQFNSFLNEYSIEEIFTIISFLEEVKDEEDDFNLYKQLYLLKSNLVDRLDEHYEYEYGGNENED